MARTRFSVSTEGEIASGTSAKTILQVVNKAHYGLAVRGLAISFTGTSGSAEPGDVELCIQTSDGTSSPATPRHDDRRATGLTIQASGRLNCTAEPTPASPEILRDWNIHPQTGVEFRWWFDEEIILAGTSDGSCRLGVRVTMPASVGVRARLFCEE